MKYIKTFEEKKDRYYLYPVKVRHLEETYEYLYRLGVEPKIYQIEDDVFREDVLKNAFFYKNEFPDKNEYCFICFKRSEKVADEIINRSNVINDSVISNFLKIDKEKEEEMDFYLKTKGFNLI